jgi:hypothetical protein
LVAVWLEITKGKQIPAGSVVVMSSATHLLMEGLEGYVEDMIRSLNKIGSIFGGGIIAAPGIPIFLGGCNSPELIRDVWDLMSWLKCIEELKLWRGWYELIGSLTNTKGGEGLQPYRCTKPRLPVSLNTFAENSWSSPGGTTLYNEVPPATMELEKKIITGMLNDLNTNFDLGLDVQPDFSRGIKPAGSEKPKILTIGGSHAGRVGDEFESRGYTVLKVCTPGWRANKHPVLEIIPKVKEALATLSEKDVIIIECLDNTAYYARTEEGGDIPVRRWINKEFHVEGELTLATQERQAIMLENLEPLFALLRNRIVVFVTPMPRYLYVSCCDRTDHATNRTNEDFEEELRRSLGEFRLNTKKLLFLKNHRFKILDPSPALPLVDKDGENVWGQDPVHPLKHGYELMVDLFEDEISALLSKGGKRAGGRLQPPAKKQRTEAPRQEWVESSNEFAKRREYGSFYRGNGGDSRGGHGGRGRGRGRGGRGGRGFRGGQKTRGGAAPWL